MPCPTCADEDLEFADAQAEASISGYRDDEVPVVPALLILRSMLSPARCQ